MPTKRCPFLSTLTMVTILASTIAILTEFEKTVSAKLKETPHH